MAGDGDGDVAGFAVADTGIAGEGEDAFFADGDDGGGDEEVGPEDFAFALAFGGEDPPGGLGEGDDERGFFARSYSGVLGRVASMEVMGSWSMRILRPSLTWAVLQPVRKMRERMLAEDKVDREVVVLICGAPCVFFGAFIGSNRVGNALMDTE